MKDVEIEIDSMSGFCFGVVNAIEHAERELEASQKTLYCLGDIVHNSKEVERLGQKGLSTIDYDTFYKLSSQRVLLRAHGEAPRIYEYAERNGLTVIDATCPVVLRLQKKIKQRYEELKCQQVQIVIYGKRGHAEVNGLVGQTDDSAIVIENLNELDKLDYQRPIVLFSQTTMSLEAYGELIAQIEEKIAPGVLFEHHDSICRQVANRIPHIRDFARKHDLIFFVAGKKSSNGRVLFEHCRAANPRSIFISSPDEIVEGMLDCSIRSIGICGATSTPKWQMQEVADRLVEILP